VRPKQKDRDKHCSHVLQILESQSQPGWDMPRKEMCMLVGSTGTDEGHMRMGVP
jgi:hypothetical protein